MYHAPPSLWDMISNWLNKDDSQAATPKPSPSPDPIVLDPNKTQDWDDEMQRIRK